MDGSSSLVNYTLRTKIQVNSDDGYRSNSTSGNSIHGPRTLGAFGSLDKLSIARQDDRDILDFVFFLENHEVELISASDVHRDSASAEGHQGGSMEVFPGTWKDRKVALKYLRRSHLPEASWRTSNPPEYRRLIKLHQRRQKDLLFEVKIMAREYFMQHRNIVSLLGVFFEDEDLLPDEPNVFSLGMVVELADQHCPDLEKFLSYDHRIRPITFSVAAAIIADIADGLSALHSFGVIHADLKPSNILMFFEELDYQKPTAKIADFGFCGIVTSGEDMRGGTTYWNAPEVAYGPEPALRFRDSINPAEYLRDIYSFGLVAAVTVLDGQLPIEPKAEKDLKLGNRVVQEVTTKLRSKPISLQYSKAELTRLTQLTAMTLSSNPKDRLENLQCVRTLLLPGILDTSNLTGTTSVVPFSFLESAAYTDEYRDTRDHYYPWQLRQYGKLPSAIVRKIDAVVESLSIETLPPPVVAQVFYWADARLDHAVGRHEQLAMLELIRTATSRMQINAKNNVPGFASVRRLIEEAVNRALEVDLASFLLTGQQEPVLLESIRLGQFEVARCLFANSVAMDAKVDPGWGAIHYAACYDRVELLEELINCGLNTEETVGDYGYTPLAIAARKGHAKSVSELIRLGAKVDPPFTGLQQVPLREAIMFSNDTQSFSDTVAVLLSSGASTDHGGFGTYPIHDAAHHPGILEQLLKHNPASVKHRDMSGETALHHAVRRLCTESVRMLLSYQADVNAIGQSGLTPLHLACSMCGRNNNDHPFHSREIHEYILSVAVGTIADGFETIGILREAGADIDATIYGADSTPDSLLYNLEDHYTEATIPFSKFQANEMAIEGTQVVSGKGRFDLISLPSHDTSIPATWIKVDPKDPSEPIDTTSTLSDGTGVLLPGKGAFSYECILTDVLPNAYELLACIGRTDGEGYQLPPRMSFCVIAEVSPSPLDAKIDTLPPSKIHPHCMGARSTTISKVCPQDECMYVVKFSEFDIYARRNLEIKLSVFSDRKNPITGGLLVKWVRLQRANTAIDELTPLMQSMLRPCDTNAIKTAMSVGQNHEGYDPD